VSKFDGWRSWQLPTSDNPYIDPSEIEQARLLLPERVFAQEYLAQFLEEVGVVFRGVRACWHTEAMLEKGQVGATYVVGADWGKHEDFTVYSVLDARTKRQVRVERMRRVDYTLQSDRLLALCAAFNKATVMAELNAMGEPICEQLRKRGLKVQGVTVTQPTKTSLIESLALAFEQRAVEVLPDEVQTVELEAYTMERTLSGTYRYGAPTGMHDDTVMALALAWSGVSVPQREMFVVS
jgi:hypothetical protein